MDFQGLHFRELVEEVDGQRAGAMLHRTAGAIFTRPFAQHLQCLEIDGYRSHRAIGQDDAAVAGACLHADLAQSDIIAQQRQFFVVVAHIGVQLFHRGVLVPHLPDLATQTHGDAFRL